MQNASLPRHRGSIVPYFTLHVKKKLELRVYGALETRDFGGTRNERLPRDEARSSADAEVAAFHTVGVYLALVLRTIRGDIRFDLRRVHPGNSADESNDARLVAEAAMLFVLRAEHRLVPLVELVGVQIPDCIFVQGGGCRVFA